MASTTIIQGLRGVGDFQANERPQNWQEQIAFDFPSGPNGLVAMLAFMDPKPVSDSKINEWQKQLTDRVIYINNAAGYGAADTDFLVDDGSGNAKAKAVVKNVVLQNQRTREQMRVTADPTNTTTITVERGVGGVAGEAAVINDNDVLFIVGMAYADGTELGTAQFVDPSQFTFYTQIFKQTYQLSRRAAKTDSRTGDQMEEHQREALERVALGMEMAAIFGKGRATTEGGKELTYAEGVINHVFVNANSNYFSGIGAISWSTFKSRLKTLFTYGSSTRLALCGNTVISTITDLAENNSMVKIEPQQELFGIRINRVTTPFGELLLYHHPLLSQIGEDGTAILLDTEQIGECYIDELDHFEGGEPNGADYQLNWFQGDLGWRWGVARTHMVLRGITGPA